MADAKVTLKPSEQIIQAANAIEYVEADGKRIGLKKPSALTQYRIVEVIGDSAKNATYMAMIAPLLWVVEIDGDPESVPSTKRELESLITRLDESGINAIIEHITGKVQPANQEESIKNS